MLQCIVQYLFGSYAPVNILSHNTEVNVIKEKSTIFQYKNYFQVGIQIYLRQQTDKLFSHYHQSGWYSNLGGVVEFRNFLKMLKVNKTQENTVIINDYPVILGLSVLHHHKTSA